MEIAKTYYANFGTNKNFNTSLKSNMPVFCGEEKTNEEKLKLALETLATINKVSQNAIKTLQDSPEENENETLPDEPKDDISCLKLPTRVDNTLRCQGITSIQQLSEMSKRDLKKLNGIGAKCAEGIIEIIDLYKQNNSEI